LAALSLQGDPDGPTYSGTTSSSQPESSSKRKERGILAALFSYQ
jgi:hypothetical protein